MFPDYSDIIERAGEPDWYDENGAPRYGKFRPRMATVYADEAALLLVACQACGWRFKGAVTSASHGWAAMQKSLDGLTGRAWQREWKRLTHLDPKGVYFSGDAPRHGGCAGETMTTDDIGILEWWDVRRNHRVRKHERMYDIEPSVARSSSTPHEEKHDA